jgi:hypothetical protein
LQSHRRKFTVGLPNRVPWIEFPCAKSLSQRAGGFGDAHELGIRLVFGAFLTWWTHAVRIAIRDLQLVPSAEHGAGDVTSFDSNLRCAGGPSLCQADNTTKNFTVNFSHTFDFDNYAYAVYGRLYRALATFSLAPVIYQLRVQAAPIVVQPGPVPEFGEPATQ